MKDLVTNNYFQQFSNDKPVIKKYNPLSLTEVYHWWQLAGGDVHMELKKHGLIRSSPPILSLPKYFFPGFLRTIEI